MESSSSDAERQQFGAALRLALEGRNRAEFIVEVMRATGESVSATALNAWLAGTSEPTRPKIYAMERLLDVPAGSLSQHLGFLPLDAQPVISPEDALLRDTTLPRAVRLALVAAIQAARG